MEFFKNVSYGLIGSAIFYLVGQGVLDSITSSIQSAKGAWRQEWLNTLISESALGVPDTTYEISKLVFFVFFCALTFGLIVIGSKLFKLKYPQFVKTRRIVTLILLAPIYFGSASYAAFCISQLQGNLMVTTSFQQHVKILGSCDSGSKLPAFQSEFSQMNNLSDYQSLLLKMFGTAKKCGLTLPPNPKFEFASLAPDSLGIIPASKYCKCVPKKILEQQAEVIAP